MATNPFKVGVAGGSQIHVMNPNEQVPNSFYALAGTATDKCIIRIGGGCKGMDDAAKQHMVQFFLKAFDGYRGVLFTGANRGFKSDGEIDLMVTELAGLIAEANNYQCIALGSVPRTGVMGIDGDYSTFRLSLNDRYTLQPNHAANLIIQSSAADVNPDYSSPDGPKWDLDLPAFVEFMSKLQDAGFNCGWTGWDGGGITRDEAILCAERYWPVLINKNTGRFCNEAEEQMAQYGTLLRNASKPESLVDLDSTDHIYLIEKLDVDAYRKVLKANSFLH